MHDVSAAASPPSPSPQAAAADAPPFEDPPEVRAVSSRPYREVTVAGVVLGVLVGVVLTAAMTYAGLVIGFIVPASTIAAILGWGLLRGVMKKGSIVENNVNQTIASGINNTSAGVIFTFPALFLLEGAVFDPWSIALAAMAGAALGALFIIPLRKQMIDLERLRFPSGMAVAAILKSPGAGARKATLLMAASGVALAFGLVKSFGFIPGAVDLGAALGLPAWTPVKFALLLLSVGAGFISGRPGMVVLAGGILANWLIAPLVVAQGWVLPPEGLPAAEAEAQVAGTLYAQIIRPLGIGFLMGGALAGVLVAVPMLRAAFQSVAGGTVGDRDELPLRWMFVGVGIAVLVLALAAYVGDPDLGVLRATATAVVGVLWMWLAGIIVAQCAGMTDWSPVSGLALLAVTLILLMVGSDRVGVAVLIGAAVCVAIAQGADMMSDLKTGFLVGSKPVRQQATQLGLAWLGPGVSVLTVYLIWTTVGFGAGTDIPAPQAETLKSIIEAFQGSAVPYEQYAIGGLVSAVLTLATGGGLGVLVGLSMYLPMMYVLTYGVGCLLAIGAERRLGRAWVGETGLPVAAGLIVGDSLAGVIFSMVQLALAGSAGGAG